jgi:hypothetical protein
MTRTTPHAGPAVNLPGQYAIVELLRLYDAAPPRSRFASLVGLSPLGAESRPWFDAAVSEISVGETLAELGEDWRVFHALPVGAEGSRIDHIDHIAIGKSGVFIIDTTNHAGQTVWASQRAFLVSGIRHPYIRNMEYEMGRAERLLGSAAGIPVEVSGILAIVAAKSITVRDSHRDVTVLAVAAVASWLRARPTVLTAEDVCTIAGVAALEGTWYRGGAPVGDRALLQERFTALRRDVRRAWRLQVMWAAALTVVGAGGFVAVTYAILVGALAAIGTR